MDKRHAAVSRLEKREKEDGFALLPDARAGFLITKFLEIGATKSTGMGPAALGWSDLADYQRCTGDELAPWQARALVAMSREYVSFAQQAEKPDCPEPWLEQDAITEERRAKVAADISRAFGALMTSKPRRSKITKRTKKGA